MAEVNGNVGGVRKETLDELAGLYDLECDADELVPRRLAETIARVSSQLDKEISVCIDRKGAVRDVSVGNAVTAAVAGINTRRGEARLSGVRCVHTHPGGTSEVSDPDLSTLFQLRLDCMVALGLSDGRVRSATVAMMPEGWNEGGQREAPPGGGGEGANDNGGAASAYGHADVYGPYALRSVPSKLIFELIAERDGYGADAGGGVTGHGRERAICVGVQIARQDDYEAEQGMLELRELAKAAGLNVVHSAHQKRGSRDSAFLIGKGFAESLAMLRQEHDATLVVVDDELSGSQVRNLEEMIGTRVIDRSSLVLDIFAMRARSREGKAQVELAQHKYRLPRLIGLGGQLSRQAGSSRVMGGVGTRGPGEKKLETDRRHIRRRVEALERELEELSKRRETGREARRRGGRDMVAIVGYTNAGKSTLLNGLCGSDVFVMDQLFATLDPTIRGMRLASGREVSVIDTVGFIRKLPHDLVESFKSTLEEALSADLLLLVADAASPYFVSHLEVARRILGELGALGKPILTVLNKMDAVADRGSLPPMPAEWGKAHEVSAATGEGLEGLKDAIDDALPAMEARIDLLVPYSEGWVRSYVHENGKLLSEEYTQDGMALSAEIDVRKAGRLRAYETV